ncbi:MAG: glycoside hydrolase family 29 [Cyclobacteriaceae bacterium]|nr:MAG: glycoside hydrolase family 29 [Cyclobacteriaceae bacterium]
MIPRITLLAAVSLLVFSCNKQVEPPAAFGTLPAAAQLAWHEMEMNAFVHFTTNTFTDKEWGYGDEDPAIFNPTAFDADQWISTFRDAGFKGVILTCKHHDGFCLWPSAFTEHSVKNSPFKKDVVKEVSEACKRHGLKFGIYVSPWDRNHPQYGSPEYIQYYRNQLDELFTNYGPIFEMWFDGANGGDGFYGGKREARKINGATYYDWPTTLDLVRKHNPDVIFFSDAGPGVRWVGNERGTAGETNWNTITPDTLFAGKGGIENLLNTGSENGTRWIPAEVDVSIRPGWFYHAKEDSLVKSPEKLFQIYLTSVGRGSTLLLNIPPDRRGIIHENDVAALKAWRALLDETFKANLAEKANVSASAVRGDAKQYTATNVSDKSPETYWALNDNETSGTLEFTFDKPQLVKYVLLQEYIKLGQRVKSFVIEAKAGDNWNVIGEGTTIGYKRIVKVKPVETTAVRITIRDAKACPVISNIELY